MTMKRLGKGLAEIMEQTAPTSPSVVMIRTEQIKASRFQPRQQFNPASLDELKASIKRKGIVQPIIVRPIAHGIYELVAGERRWRAAQAIGIQEVPAIVRTISDKESMEVGLVENLQRDDLNAMEQARAFDRLIKEFGYTQEDVAETVSKDRATVANFLRLLALSQEIQQGVLDGKISAGHAKAILSVDNALRQLELFRETVRQQWSVRELERMTYVWQPRVPRKRRAQDAQTKVVEERLRQQLGTKVIVASRRKGGRIVIEYFSQDDLARILGALGVRLDG